MSYDTKTPLKDVYVKIDTIEKRKVTNYRGIAIIPYEFNQLELDNAEHVRTVIKYEEVKDTIWMLPKAQSLSEVVVYGDRVNLAEKLLPKKSNDPLSRSGKPSNLDIMGSVQKLFSIKKNKRRKKDEEILREYDFE